MSRTIWKFRLEITDEQMVDLPLGAEVLSVGMQGQDLHVWALVNPDYPAAQALSVRLGPGSMRCHPECLWSHRCRCSRLRSSWVSRSRIFAAHCPSSP